MARILLLTLCIQYPHLLAGQLQMRFQLLFAAEAVAPSIGFDFRAVQRHPLQRDQSLGAQHAQHLHEQIIQSCLVLRAETGQRPMADRFQTAQPLQPRLKPALPRYLARGTDPAAVGVQPHTDQQPRVRMLAPGVALDRSNLRVIQSQVQAAYQFPKRTRTVVLVDQLLQHQRYATGFAADQ